MGSGISFEVSPQLKTEACFNIGFLGCNSDKIRVCQADEKIIEVIREAIVKSWEPGISSETASQDQGVFDFKLGGSPFSFCHTTSTEFKMVRICKTIVEDLMASGWQLSLSTDHVKMNKTHTWFFEKCEPMEVPFCSINFASWNEVQLVDFPEKGVAMVRECLLNHIPVGIKKERDEKEVASGHMGLAFFLAGWIWTKNKICAEFLQNRRAALSIIQEMEKLGWSMKVTTQCQNVITGVDQVLFWKDPNLRSTDKFMLALCSNDSFMLVEAPSEISNITRKCIQTYWKDGIQEEGVEDATPWFKFKGYPWWNRNIHKMAETRLLMVELFRAYRKDGWRARSSIDLTKWHDDTSSFIFEEAAPKDIQMCSICFARGDTMRIFGGIQDIHDFFEYKIAPLWSKGAARVRHPVLNDDLKYQLCTELKFPGMPFVVDARSDESRMRILMCFVVEQLRAQLGWEIVCSGDLCSKWMYNHGDKTTRPMDSHTWFLTPIETD